LKWNKNYLSGIQHSSNSLEKQNIMKAIWKGQVNSESIKTINIEGNQYFPIESVNKEFLHENEIHTVCPWKGTASYYNVVVDGKTAYNGKTYSMNNFSENNFWFERVIEKNEF
jgi:uncharacterized protein (DUF427 family)